MTLNAITSPFSNIHYNHYNNMQKCSICEVLPNSHLGIKPKVLIAVWFHTPWEISRNETRTDLCNLLRAYFLDSRQYERRQKKYNHSGYIPKRKMFTHTQSVAVVRVGRTKRNSSVECERDFPQEMVISQCPNRFGCILCINKIYNYCTVGLSRPRTYPWLGPTNGTCAHFWWLAFTPFS